MKANFSLFFLFTIFVFSCSKSNSKLTLISGRDTSLSIAKRTDLIDGQCPYPCTDTRCKIYQSGYCGTPTPPTTTISVVANPNNPYDYIGTYHNQGVAFVFNNITSTSPVSMIQKETNVFLATKGYDTVFINKSLVYASPTYYAMPDTAYASNPSLLTQKLYSNGKIGFSCYTYLNQIFAFFNTDIGSNSPTIATYNKFATDIVGVENTATNDKNLTTVELEYVLTAGSIARNSAAYWGNYQLTSTSNTAPVSLNTKQGYQVNLTKRIDAKAPPRSFSWGNVGKADAAGAIGGCCGGAIAGVLVGGIGAGPGAIAGAVGGGVSGSVGVAVYQIFNW